MFGFIDDALDIMENVAEAGIDKVDRFFNDPLGQTIETVTQPLVDAIEIVEGLSEGELREKAILRLGADVVAGMATSELIDWYQTAEDS